MSEVRLDSAAPVSVAAYTRPPTLEHLTRVPEDYRDSVDAEERQPIWFALRPAVHDQLLADGRALSLIVQRRPPEDDPLLRQGEFLWEDFHPVGDWVGRYLLTPLEEGAPRREEALAATFVPVPSGQSVDLAFAAPFGLVPEPRLVFLRETAAPVPFTLHVDGLLHAGGHLVGRRGEIPLPPLEAGRHRVVFEAASAGRFFISHVQGGGPAYLKRLVNRLPAAGEMAFDFERRSADEETLSVRLYAPAGPGARRELRAWLEPLPLKTAGPFTSWTLGSRRFSVDPAGGEAVAVLGTSGEWVDQGQLLFLPLGEDLPPGRYRLHLRLADPGEAYLSLSRLTPGRFAQRLLRREAAWMSHEGLD